MLSESPSSDTANLELKRVGDFEGCFFVPAYQRGYRWTPHEVGCLLNDILDNGARQYSLQPIVVKRRPDSWEVVDGQQRLTTLYLVFLYMKREGLQNQELPFSLTYETRPRSEAYLRSLDPEEAETNIDFHHLYAAYRCIAEWFESFDKRRQNTANKINEYLFDYVQVIWYEAPDHLAAVTLFRRLNVGRIPLTDAELVKALLLSRIIKDDGSDRAQEIATQWDAIERQLHTPTLWGFVTNADTPQYPTRIGLLLDSVAGGIQGRYRPLFHTFDQLRAQIEATSARTVWEKIVDRHELIVGWHEDRAAYHKIGYLVALGQRFSDLVPVALERTKRAFRAALDKRIRDALDLTPSKLADLAYGNRSKKCSDLLLLMNVETTRKLPNSSERYPFHRHAREQWSLEHIHAQQAESLNRVDQWQEWLRLHRDALRALKSEDFAQHLIARIEAVIDSIDQSSFLALAHDVTRAFDLDRGSGGGVHSISNLALLPRSGNSALSNSVFEVKRRRILEMDRQGEFIPICTRRVFLKYYTRVDAHQLHFWSDQDRKSYLDAMLSPEGGVIVDYLRAEV